MATLLHSESRRLYSWWWSSHISPKNSKWLQENLTDMDAKVKAMIKLIEEDADSFARRAEMYYKRRPELMKLVEEFYRAYRALAERYNHATVELRQAHRTMAEAFPDQVPYALSDDSASSSSIADSDHHTPEMPRSGRKSFESDDLHSEANSSTNLQAIRRHGAYSGPNSGISKRGLKQVHEIFDSDEVTSQSSTAAEERTGESSYVPDAEDTTQSFQQGFPQLASENLNLKRQILSEAERASKAENEVQSLRKTLAAVQAEKETIFVEYQQNMEKLSHLKKELDCALEETKGVNEQASKVEIEIKILKEAQNKLESERDAILLKYNQNLEKISGLETKLFLAEKEVEGLNKRAVNAESELQNLKYELSRLEAEKEAGLLQYRQCLQTISILENKISQAELDARKFSEEAASSEAEIRRLKQAIATSNEEKEATASLYKQCLERLARLESELSHAQEEVEQLSGEMLLRTTKLKNAEERCSLLERSNLTLQSEAENLAKKITLKDQELSRRNEELEKLQNSVQDENQSFLQVQDSLQTLQKLHCESQEEQRALATEIRVGFQMLKELEMCKHGLEEEIKLVKEENKNLSKIKLSSTVSEEKMKDELCGLNRMKEKLEEDLDAQATLSNALQQEICQLREDTKGLNGCYQALLSQVKSAGLDPKNLESSVRALRDENSKLRENNEKDREHEGLVYEKLKSMDKLIEQNTALERSLSELNGELNISKEKIKLLQESCQFLQGEKSSLVTDKAALLSQLQLITENMQKILEKNTSLENSLFAAKVEVESLREKANRLDDLCQLLMKEKSNLLDERSTLVLQLDSVETRLSNLERRFTNLEEKCSKLEMEKESTLCQVEELRGYLSLEKEERATYIRSSETRLAALENQVHVLQEEIQLRKKDFEEELERAVNAQVEIFILQKFVEDLEAKNLSLFLECQKHAEASKLSNKLISELEIENLEQQVEVEMLSDEVGQLRTEIYQVFRALQTSPEVGYKDEIERENVPSHVEQVSLLHILDNIEHLKMSLLRNKDDKQKLLIENSVVLTLLGQLRSESAEIESRKNLIEKEIKIMAEQCLMLEEDKYKLQNLNQQLRLEVDEGGHCREVLQADLRNMDEKLGNIQEAYQLLQAEYSKACRENKDLLEKVRVLEQHKHTLEVENSVMLEEVVALDNLSLVLKSFGMEKADELTCHAHKLQSLHVLNNNLKEEIAELEGKLEKKRLENLHLVDSIERLNMELHEVRDFNDEINHQILIGNDFLREKARELSEVEQKLELSQRSTLKLCSTLEELKREQEKTKLCTSHVEKQIEEFSVVKANQEKEIESLLEVNNGLEYEVHVLRQEIEEHRIREENLSSELQERSQEFELWEAEASAFYFDLQISAVHEVLLENKVHELTELCESLRDASSQKSGEIEHMKDRVDFLESEIGSLKDQLSTFVPIISSLKDNMPTVEQTTILWRTCHLEGSPDPKGVEVEDKVRENCHKKAREEQTAAPPEEISDLRKMQSRIEAVEKAVMEERERLKGQEKLMAMVGGLRDLEQESTLLNRSNVHKEEALYGKSQKTSPKAFDIRTALLTKDIPLDQDSFNGRNSKQSGSGNQMLELEESSRDSCLNPAADEIENITSASEPDVACHQFEHVLQKSQDSSTELQVEKELGVDRLEITSSRELGKEMNRRKLLERLTSDAQKLTVLKAKVQDMKGTAEVKKKNKKANNQYETVKKQLQEVEEAVEQLMVVNDHLARNVDKNTPSHESVLLESKDIGSVHRKKVREQAKIESEKIGRLQFELQNIHYILLKMQDEKKTKGKSRFSSRTGIILRDFIYNGGRSSEKRQKKGCLCGCARPRTDGD